MDRQSQTSSRRLSTLGRNLSHKHPSLLLLNMGARILTVDSQYLGNVLVASLCARAHVQSIMYCQCPHELMWTERGCIDCQH
jgi:hypothetical protein